MTASTSLAHWSLTYCARLHCAASQCSHVLLYCALRMSESNDVLFESSNTL